MSLIDKSDTDQATSNMISGISMYLGSDMRDKSRVVLGLHFRNSLIV